MEHVTSFKAVLVGCLAALTALWGWFGWLVIAFAACMTIDWITGTRAAKASNEWKSSIARSGLNHKTGMIAGVLVALILDAVVGLMLANIPEIELPFTYSVLMAPFVLLWFIFTELGSILENAEKLGTKLPPFLKSFIEIAKAAIGKANNKDED